MKANQFYFRDFTMAWERHLLEYLTVTASKYQEIWFKENPGQTGVFQVVSVKTL